MSLKMTSDNDPIVKWGLHGSDALFHGGLVCLVYLSFPALRNLRVLQLLFWVLIDLPFLHQSLLPLLNRKIGVFLYDLVVVFGVDSLGHVADRFLKSLILLDHCNERSCWAEHIRRGAWVIWRSICILVWNIWIFNWTNTFTFAAFLVNLFAVIL